MPGWFSLFFIYCILSCLTVGVVLYYLWKGYMIHSLDNDNGGLETLFATIVVILLTPVIVPVFILFMIWSWINKRI